MNRSTSEYIAYYMERERHFVGIREQCQKLVEELAKDEGTRNLFMEKPFTVLAQFDIPLPEKEEHMSLLEQNLKNVDITFSWKCSGCKITLNVGLAALTVVILAALAATAPGEFLIAVGVAQTIALMLDVSITVVTAALAGLTTGLVVTLEEFIAFICEKTGFCPA